MNAELRIKPIKIKFNLFITTCGWAQVLNKDFLFTLSLIKSNIYF